VEGVLDGHDVVCGPHAEPSPKASGTQKKPPHGKTPASTAGEKTVGTSDAAQDALQAPRPHAWKARGHHAPKRAAHHRWRPSRHHRWKPRTHRRPRLAPGGSRFVPHD
jgi:hypothetical protein